MTRASYSRRALLFRLLRQTAEASGLSVLSTGANTYGYWTLVVTADDDPVVSRRASFSITKRARADVLLFNGTVVKNVHAALEEARDVLLARSSRDLLKRMAQP